MPTMRSALLVMVPADSADCVCSDPFIFKNLIFLTKGWKGKKEKKQANKRVKKKSRIIDKKR